MTKDELWSAYVDRNPSFAGEANITLAASGIRKLFDQTWEIAYKTGLEKGAAFSDKLEDAGLFNEMLGGFKK